MFCDSNIERYVRKNYYETLKKLSPPERFAKKIQLEIENLDFDIRDDDEIIGWFLFPKTCKEEVSFPDERLTKETEDQITAPEKFNSRTNVDRGHTLVDYESILKNGLVAYEKRIAEELQKEPQNEFLIAMKSTISSIVAMMRRIADAIDEKRRCADKSQEEKWVLLKRIIEKVPYYPAETFREAVQSVWIIHFLVPLAENAWYSISLGRFDQYMYPYYKRSMADGMTWNEAKKILHHFYKLLNHYADGACLLNIGPSYNELSERIIECQKDFGMPAPILGARMDENTPDAIWESLIDEKLFSMGQPTFYGEKSCRRALCEKGLPDEEAKEFSNNSCMGISIVGNEFNSMWGCVFTVCSALEMALNGGRMLNGTEEIVPNICVPKDKEALFQNFEKCARRLLEICVKAYEKRAEISEKTVPDCLVSLLTPGCIEKHCDRISGAKYHNVTVECMGMINAADGIHAIDQLVFREKKYTIDQMNMAVKNNFKGFEEIRNAMVHCFKFGENSEADVDAIRVAEMLQKIIRSFCHGNLFYCPSLHTLDANVRDGMAFGASYDGRYAKTPFAKNAGPANEARKADPTSMILSSSKLPQHQFFGGQPIDVNFQTEMVQNHKSEIKTLIKIYLERGGLQFQVNALSSKLLRDATDHPEKYPNLVVRIGGYSVYFNALSKASKEEFIERLEKEGA